MRGERLRPRATRRRQTLLLFQLGARRAHRRQAHRNLPVKHLLFLLRAVRELDKRHAVRLDYALSRLDGQRPVDRVRRERTQVPLEVVRVLAVRPQEHQTTRQRHRRRVAENRDVRAEREVHRGGQRGNWIVRGPLAFRAREGVPDAIPQRRNGFALPPERLGERPARAQRDRRVLHANNLARFFGGVGVLLRGRQQNAHVALVRLLLHRLEHPVDQHSAPRGHDACSLHAGEHGEVPGVGVEVLDALEVQLVPHGEVGGVAQLDGLRRRLGVAHGHGRERVHRHRGVRGADVQAPQRGRGRAPAQLQTHAAPLLDAEQSGQPVRAHLPVRVLDAHRLPLPRLERAETRRDVDDFPFHHAPLVRVHFVFGLADFHPVLQLHLDFVPHQNAPLRAQRRVILQLQVHARGRVAQRAHAEADGDAAVSSAVYRARRRERPV